MSVHEALEAWKTAVHALKANPDSAEAQQNEAEAFEKFNQLMEKEMDDGESN